MSQVALTWGIPLYPQSNLSKESIFKQTKGEETKRSIGLRITVVALGAIAVIIGSLMVSGVIHQWGAIAGGSIIAVGGGLMLVGILMKEVKHNSKKQSHSQSADSESPKIKQTSKKAAQKGKQSNTSNKGKGKTASKTGGQVNNSKKKPIKGDKIRAALIKERLKCLKFLENGKIGGPGYKAAFANMFKLAESLPQVQVGLYGYKFGPKKNDVCYIVEHKDKQIEEIDAETALIIDQQRKIDGVGSWPYFSSKLNCNVTFQGDIKFFKGKAVSEQLAQLVSQYNAKRSVVAYNTLDVLGYYHSKEIKNICDDKLYKQLQKVLPYRYK